MTSTLKHINAVLLVFLALVYIMPNFYTTTLAVTDGMEQTSQDTFASDVEEKEFIDTDISLIPNCNNNYLWCNYVTLNYISNQVIEPVIKRPTPPPQA